MNAINPVLSSISSSTTASTLNSTTKPNDNVTTILNDMSIQVGEIHDRIIQPPFIIILIGPHLVITCNGVTIIKPTSIIDIDGVGESDDVRLQVHAAHVLLENLHHIWAGLSWDRAQGYSEGTYIAEIIA
ncbi:1166_t:CDS:2 [Paraglomus brasilianum]|uniref:1166_t:CDS:1 n=1 Tax=Paraglomus brasilianum TaxID=144538 RepID=A0A9N9AX54_9GLOM|nr:1166_t:CDS:2 [Paraglomus brasilianum]